MHTQSEHNKLDFPKQPDAHKHTPNLFMFVYMPSRHTKITHDDDEWCRK